MIFIDIERVVGRISIAGNFALTFHRGVAGML